MLLNIHQCKLSQLQNLQIKLTSANMPCRPHYCCTVTKLIYQYHFILFLANKVLLFFILFIFTSTKPLLLKLLINIVEVEVEVLTFVY